ncbi:hypothetical protein [Agarivorans sp. 1_MG-2023]|nr:hypothetical protein [Agarivorans sp. 1_MG-2023]MDO6762656.1 hypothetical protein [Agarivorans sp. 1_MG-2023]
MNLNGFSRLIRVNRLYIIDFLENSGYVRCMPIEVSGHPYHLVIPLD